LSLFEFVYSCRDSYNSTYPNPNDKAFIDCLNMMKRIKEEVASGFILLKYIYIYYIIILQYCFIIISIKYI